MLLSENGTHTIPEIRIYNVACSLNQKQPQHGVTTGHKSMGTRVSKIEEFCFAISQPSVSGGCTARFTPEALSLDL
mgnify:CR=1 FL=1